jgi:hypothetical protein
MKQLLLPPFAAALGSFAVALGAMVLAGCSGSGTSTGTSPGSGGQPISGVCAKETRATKYSAGMTEKTSSNISVSIEDAAPAPPAVGNNDWTLSVKDASGNPMPGAALTVYPFMVDHGHTGGRKTIVTDNGDGTYHCTPVNFNMEGYWEITVTVAKDTTKETAMFPLCVE